MGRGMRTRLAAAAEQLAQDALLDVVHLPDAWRQARHQPLVDRRVIAQLLRTNRMVSDFLEPPSLHGIDQDPDPSHSNIQTLCRAFS